MTTPRKTEQIDRIDGLFGGIESFDRTTQSMGVDVGKAFPNGADESTKKRYANITFVSFAKKKRPAEVAPTWDMARSQYAQQVFGVDAPDDATFYSLVGQHFAKEKNTRAIASEMAMGLTEKAISGRDFLESYNGFLSEAAKKPGYENADLSVIHEFARKTWNDSVAKAEQYAPLIDMVETHYATSGGFDEGFDKLVPALSVLSPEDARFVIDTAAARQKQVSKAAEGQDKPMKLGALVSVARAGRGAGRIWTAAKEEIIPTANIFPWWDKDVSDESHHQESIKRRLRQNQTGEIDPLKADSWFGERMLEAADSVPYMVAAGNKMSMPVVILALKNEARTGLIEEGVDPETANKISTVAGPLMAAIEMVQSKIAFKNLKFAGTANLKKSTISAVARRLTTRTAGALAGELVTENLQDMTPVVMQELWSKFDEAVPDPVVADKFKEFWKKSPEMAVAFLPLVLIGSAGATRQDVQLFKADTMVRDRLLAVGVTPAEVDEVVQASTVGRIAFSEAIKRVSKNADVRSAEAKAAQDRVQAEIDANKTPEGYDANFNSRGNLEVTTADGQLVTEASSAPEAQQAIRDTEFKKLLSEEEQAKAALDQTEVKSAGDVAEDPLPGRPASSPREDLEAWNKTGEEYTAEIAAAKEAAKGKPADERVEAIQAVADKYGKLRESLKNRHFGGENPSEEIIAGLKEGKTPAQVQRPDAEAAKVDAETAVREPTPAPDRDGTPPVPTAIALNHKEIETARDTFGRAKLNKLEREKHAHVLNQVKIDGSWSGAYNEAKRILAENDLPTLQNQMQFLVYLADAENRRLGLLEEAERARAAGELNKAGAKELQADAIRTEIGVIETAAYHGGSRLGKALNARRRALDRKQYELAPLLQRARRKVPDIAKEQELELGRMAQQVLELQAEIVRLEQSLAERQAEADQQEAGNFVTEGVSKRTKARKENAQSRRAALKKQLQALGYRTNIVSDGGGWTSEAMSAIAGIAETYIDEGAATLWEVSGKLKADIPDLSDQDIFNALGRRNKKATKKILDETQARIKELKTQAKLWGDIHDALNGVFKDGTEQLAGSEKVQQLREIMGRLRLQANKSIHDAAQIANAEARLNQVVDMLVGGYREVDPVTEKKQENEKLNQVREQIAETLREMRTLDTLYEVREEKRTGEKADKEEREAETNPRIAEYRKEIAALRKEMRDEGATQARRQKLRDRIAELQKQLDGDFRDEKDPKATRAEPADIQQLKEHASLLQREMDLIDAVRDLEEQLRTGVFLETREATGRVNQKIQLLEDRVGELRKEVSKRKNAPKREADTLKRLEERIASVREQAAGGFRYIPEGKTRTSKTVREQELRAELKRLEALMRTDDAILNLQDQLRRLREGDASATQLSAREKRVVEDNELEDRRIKMRQLKRKIDNRIEEMRKKTGLEKAIDVLLSPRAFQSTADMSGIARQGVMLVARDIFSRNLGRNVGKSTVAYWNAMFSENKYDGIALAMNSHPNYKELVRMGIEFQELDGTPNQRDEHFMTNLAEKVPGFGKVVRGGNRGMITFLNLMRFSAGDQFLEAYPDASVETKERMASLINKLSGRGNLGNAKAFTKELNVIFYAPKYAISRYQVLWAPIIYRNDKTVLKEWTKYMGSFAAFTATIFTMAILAGFDVEDDPTSSDFLKVRAGRVRYDAMGGMQQPLRLLLLTAYSAGHRNERYADPLDTGLQFLKFKLNPAVTVPEQLITGKDWRNQPVSAFETLASSVTPIILQEVVDALVNEPEQALPVAAASFVGVGATVYDEKKSARKGKAQP